MTSLSKSQDSGSSFQADSLPARQPKQEEDGLSWGPEVFLRKQRYKSIHVGLLPSAE